MGFWRTLKKALASDCDEMGVQFNIGRRTLLPATRRLNDRLPSEKKFDFQWTEKCKTLDTNSFLNMAAKDKRLQNMILTIFNCLHFSDYPRYLKDMFRLRSSNYF